MTSSGNFAARAAAFAAFRGDTVTAVGGSAQVSNPVAQALLIVPNPRKPIFIALEQCSWRAQSATRRRNWAM